MNASVSRSKPKKVKFDEEFRRIQLITENILGEAFGATLDQRQFQTALFALLQPEFDRILKEGEFQDELQSPEERAKFLRSTIDRNNELSQQAADLSKQAADAAANLGTLTEGDRELISSIIGNARNVGQQQIDAFVTNNFRAANEVAAARGFRPSDAPIGNIRGRVAEEAVSQKGLLESQLASRGAELGLQLPQQRLALLGQFAGQQTGLAQAGSQFQAALQQNATANRLNLAQTVGQLGLGITGISGTGPGTLQASRPAFGTKTKTVTGGLL